MNENEGQTREYKLIWNENAYKTCCAFANTDGGRIYVGYDDNGNLIGIRNVKGESENLPNSIRSKLGLYVSVYAGSEEGKDYIEVVIPPVSHPVFYEGKIYIRSGSTNQLLEGNNLIGFILQKSKDSWDDVIVDNISVDDLDEESFIIFKEEGVRNKRLTEYDRKLDRKSLLKKLSLLKDERLTRAAVLLFHPHPELFFPGAHVKIGYFDKNNHLRFQDEMYGSLLSLARHIEELLVLKYMYATIDYDGLTRVETLPYPREAIREGLLNALMHNNYMSSQPIAIRVSPYELWISNRCIFPSGWTEDTLFSVHESRQLNPNIAIGFFRAGLVERFGSGIQKIVDFCKENGNPKPRYSIYPEMITLKLQSRPENIKLALGELNGELNGGLNGLNRRKALLQTIQDNPSCTAADISTALMIPKRTIDRDIAWLKENGYLIRSGSKKNGAWNVVKDL